MERACQVGCPWNYPEVIKTFSSVLVSLLQTRAEEVCVQLTTVYEERLAAVSLIHERDSKCTYVALSPGSP